MKTKLLKKIESRIKIIDSENGYEVHIKDNISKNWHLIRKFKKFGDALYQKHHYVRAILMKDLGVIIRYRKKFGKYYG